MKAEIKEQLIEILQNNNDIYDGYITTVLDNLREFLDTLEESSVESRILENIIIDLTEFENDDLDLLEMQNKLMTLAYEVKMESIKPVITDRNEVIKFLLSKRREE